MELLSQALVLVLVLVLALSDVVMADHHGNQRDRCKGVEFDAVTPDAHGNPMYFKGDHMWRGRTGPAEPINGSSFEDLDQYHHRLGHIDAALRLDRGGSAGPAHQHVYFFLGDQVLSYHDHTVERHTLEHHTLEDSHSKNISEVFPGIPSPLDAAVECPVGEEECVRDSVIFFKSPNVFFYDTCTKNVTTRQWTHLPNCTAALRMFGSYYCFHGHEYTRFHPVTGAVMGEYPRKAASFFMECPNAGPSSPRREGQDHSQVHPVVSLDGLKRPIQFRETSPMRESARDSRWRPQLASAAVSCSYQLYLITYQQQASIK